MDVTLENRTRRPRRGLVLNLTKGAAPVRVTHRTTEEDRQGRRRQRVIDRIVPGSLRVPAGKRVKVDEKILRCPEVAAAIARRDLLVHRAPENADTSTKADTSTETDKDETKSRGGKPRRKR